MRPVTYKPGLASSAPNHSTHTALKSTALIGGASLINLAITVVRTKCVAMLIGPAGVGLIGAYGSLITLVTTLAGMGINNSGVRQIAEAVGTQDETKISRVARALRWTAIVLGLIGATFMACFAKPLGFWTFGTHEHTTEIALLSIVVLLTSISAGQSALIQGTRQLRSLAKMSIIGSVFGLVVSVPIVWIWRDQGIVLFIIAGAAMGIASSWWFASKIKLVPLLLSWQEVAGEAIPLLRLGAAFMVSGLLTAGVAYLVRSMIVQQMGLDAAGHYQACWVLSSLYVGFILSAMGSDYYPRLTALAHDPQALSLAVNEQTELSLLLAGPGIVVTLALAPVVIVGFYSRSFIPAIAVLEWQVLGVLLQVASWPLGFILLAMGKGKLFIAVEIASNSFYLLSLWLFVHQFGLRGTGMAFATLYAFHLVILLVVVRLLVGFRFSQGVLKVMFAVGMMVVATFLTVQFLSQVVATTIGLCLAVLAGLYSAMMLNKLVPNTRPARVVRRAMMRIGFYNQS